MVVLGAISFFVLTRQPENNLLDFFIKNRDNYAFQFHGIAQSRCFIFCVRQTLTRSLYKDFSSWLRKNLNVANRT